MTPLRGPDHIFVYVIRAGVALILLTPFVVSPPTIFPPVVGKALYSRSLIEVVLASWVLLCLFQPSWRPPRSRILVLLAVALGVAVLSAGFGVSVQRSLWSNYERMQGVIDQAHWFALAVVLVSVLRTSRDWRIVLACNSVAGMVMALMTVAEHHGHSWIGTSATPRAMATLGSPIFLGTYLGVTVTIALGFLIRSFVSAAHPGKAPVPAREGSDGRSNRRNSPREARSARLPMPWAGRCFWGTTVLIGLWALTLTGSRGPFLGFVSGLVFLATLYVFLARMRMIRLVAAGSAGLLGVVAILLLVLSFSPAASLIDAWNANPLLSRLADHEPPISVRQRLLAWEAGIKGFTESPILGWGPENYVVVWGRHGSEFITTMPGVFDHSHNKLIEELVTKGLSGLLVHVAIWGFAFHIVWRTAGDMDSRERVPVLFVGAALMGYFVQSMTTLDSAVGSLQFILLLAFVAHLETTGSDRRRPGQGGRTRLPASFLAGKLTRFVGSHGARVSLVAGTIVFAGAGLFANKVIYSSAQAVKVAYTSATDPAGLPDDRTRIHIERAINGFEPLANYPRRVLFHYASERWTHLRARNPDEAGQLLAMVNAEASAAVESEPRNWWIYMALVPFYAAVAVTDPEYGDAAERYFDRVLELAPHI